MICTKPEWNRFKILSPITFRFPSSSSTGSCFVRLDVNRRFIVTEPKIDWFHCVSKVFWLMLTFIEIKQTLSVQLPRWSLRCSFSSFPLLIISCLYFFRFVSNSILDFGRNAFLDCAACVATFCELNSIHFSFCGRKKNKHLWFFDVSYDFIIFIFIWAFDRSMMGLTCVSRVLRTPHCHWTYSTIPSDAIYFLSFGASDEHTNWTRKNLKRGEWK